MLLFQLPLLSYVFDISTYMMYMCSLRSRMYACTMANIVPVCSLVRGTPYTMHVHTSHGVFCHTFSRNFITYRSPLIAKIRSFVSIQKQSIVKAVAKCEVVIHIWFRECYRYVSIQKRSIVRVLLGFAIFARICCREIQQV